MPLHKSSRAPRLDPTMISAPLGDFRHTMHIGRGGDAFGDTSFLSTLGPSQAKPEPESSGIVAATDLQPEINHSDLHTNALGSQEDDELQNFESMSSFTMDLDLDLGPSMLGDVLGVMDSLGFDSNEEDGFVPKSVTSPMAAKQGKGGMEMSVNMHNELNEKNLVGLEGIVVGDSRTPDGNGIKPKGLRPKVRFSDKREEIIRQKSEEEEGHAIDFQDHSQLPSCNSTKDESLTVESTGSGVETEFTHNKLNLPPSPASSYSSDYDGEISLDRRRVDSCHSETDSEEEEEEVGRGYTFEDEFDDEIGL